MILMSLARLQGTHFWSITVATAVADLHRASRSPSVRWGVFVYEASWTSLASLNSRPLKCRMLLSVVLCGIPS